jgi:hypothetical protein
MLPGYENERNSVCDNQTARLRKNSLSAQPLRARTDISDDVIPNRREATVRNLLSDPPSSQPASPSHARNLPESEFLRDQGAAFVKFINQELIS